MEKQYNQLLKQYTRYIEFMANTWSNGDQEMAKELEQVGRIELYEIMDKIDEEKGDQTTYVTMMVKYAMKEYLTKYSNIIRIPNHIQHSSKWKQDTQHLSTISTNTPINEDGGILEDLLGDKVEDNSPTDEQLKFKERFKEALNQLKPQWRYILLNHYGYNDNEAVMTLQQIGDKLGITRQAVSLQLEKAKEAIKDYVLNK